MSEAKELTAIDPAELEADLDEVMAAGGEPHHKEMVAKFARIANQALLERDASRAREKALVEALRHARDQIRHPDQLIDEALQPYSTPSPDMPSDCHPQGE